MRRKALILAGASFAGAILGYLLFYFIHIGWLNSQGWNRVPPPPEALQQLLVVDAFGLLAQGQSGSQYYFTYSQDCPSGCWLQASNIGHDISEETFLHPWIDTDREPCAAPRPLLGITSKVGSCFHEAFVDHNLVYVLLSNGDVRKWEANLYGEYAFFSMVLWVCSGLLVFFILTLLYLLFTSTLSKLEDSANSRAKAG